MTRASLRTLPAYQLGREDERKTTYLSILSTVSNQLSVTGDERDAYLLGRMEERNEQARRQRKQVSA